VREEGLEIGDAGGLAFDLFRLPGGRVAESARSRSISSSASGSAARTWSL
jgi:hypothetical protein